MTRLRGQGNGGKRWWLATSMVVVILMGMIGGALAQQGSGRGNGPGSKPDSREETAGNNLSFPVIWSDGVELPLRGTAGTTVFEGEYTPLEGIPYYHQQDLLNEWQADSYNAVLDVAEGELIRPVDVTRVDWGDNLEAKAWTVNSIVRVETVLYQDLTDVASVGLPESMVAYRMAYLFGEGPDEMQGTNGDELLLPIDRLAVEPGTEGMLGDATVYTDYARLTIQKIAEPGDLSLVWDPIDKRWKGANAGLVFFNGAVYEGGDGPGYYSAEINVGGKVVYGFNWNVRRMSNGAGVYRITFSIDRYNASGELLDGVNTVFDETEVIPFGEGGGEEALVATANPSGGVTVMDTGNDLTFVDVIILPRASGGGKGKP